MSVNLYTPDANVIVHETKVDFRRRIVQRQINLVQYDKSMPVIAVQLCSNGNEYVLPENASAYIRFGKRDHTYVYNECLGCDQTRTIVYFAITDQMTVFYGEHTPIVELRIGDTVAGSGSIPIWIDRNPIQNGDTESKSDLSVFEKAIEAAQKINVKLPTDLKATATNLSLLAGSTKIGSGINLRGFEYDEATNTLKASVGGGASVSPCLNLLDRETQGIRTSITEEEKNNLDKGLYNSVLYFDESAEPLGFISTFFPEPLAETEFSIFNLTADEATQKITITGSSVYHIEVFDKNEDGTYPISIQKIEELEASFGGDGGGSVDTSTMTEKLVTLVEEDATEDCPLIQKYHGIYGLYKILDGRAGAIKIDGSWSNDVIFIGYPFWYKNDVHDGYLIGSIYMGEEQPRSLDPECDYAFVGTGVYEFFNGEINITPKGCVGNMTLSGLALLAGHETASDEITTAIQNGGESRPYYDVNLMALQYGFKETADGSAVIKTFLGYVDHKTTWTSNKLKLSGLFDGKQGTAVLEKDSSGAWVSNTPIEYIGAQETHHHTLTIKDGTKIIFATNRELESATAATNLETLISTFAGTTTAGFGDYILLTVDTAAKLKKQDGTEVNLSTLTVTIEDIVK